VRIPISMTVMLLCMHPFYAAADTLQQAMEHATLAHPLLQMAEQQQAVARGNLSEQDAYAYNPELSIEPQRRRLNGGGSSNDYYITLSQGVELGGKRALREQSARAALAVAGHAQAGVRQQLIIEAARAYVALYFADQAYELRRRQSEMLGRVSRAVVRQMELGESSLLDANLARSAAASALNATSVARQQLNNARQRYRLALGQTGEGADAERPGLTLPQLSLQWHPPADAYQVALASRPDLAGLRAGADRAQAEAQLAGAARIPDITLSAMSGREAGDRLVKLGVTIPLPLLNMHRGAYRAALARQEQAGSGLNWAKQQLRYAVQSALDNHANAMRALSDISAAQMCAHADDTIALAQRAYDAGELDMEELVVHIRQGLDARMTALEITKQAWLARIRVAEVLGHPEYILKGIQS